MASAHAPLPYEKGLVEVGDGVLAYLQPDGSWGLSNSLLVVGEGESLLVDTLFDLRLTREMLDAMASVTAGAPITTVVNTHANGDHCYGNQLVGAARVVASQATAGEMAELPPSMLAALKAADLGEEGNRFVAAAFGPFDFDGIVVPPPTETFSGRTTLTVGGRSIELFEVGPAHTRGDVVVHVPDAGVVATGDIAFLGSTPIIWAGPVAGWLAALELVRGLGPRAVVPGHGPVSGVDSLDWVEAYLRFLLAEVSRLVGDGPDRPAGEVAAAIDLGKWGGLHDPERIVINVDSVLAEVVPDHRRLGPLELMQEIGRYGVRRGLF